MFGQPSGPAGLGSQASLIEVFLVKLELERLTSQRGQGVSKAEQALQIENKILKQRLRTLKDNINILNSMIDHIKIGGGKKNSSDRKESQISNDGRQSELGRGRDEETADVRVIADDIKQVYNNNQSLKDQNNRLMVVNEKLLNESESLRKEIYRLRNLFGDESFIAGGRGGGQSSNIQSDRPDKSDRIS